MNYAREVDLLDDNRDVGIESTELTNIRPISHLCRILGCLYPPKVCGGTEFYPMALFRGFLLSSLLLIVVNCDPGLIVRCQDKLKEGRIQANVANSSLGVNTNTHIHV